jgi:hypothetical protein
MRNAAMDQLRPFSMAWRRFTLGKDLGVSTSEAKSHIESYSTSFQVRGCLDAILEEARRTRR